MSKRVNGAALKAALNLTAPKQVAAGGFAIDGAAVTFRGKQAFAVWRKGYRGDSRSFRINYPLLSDTAALTRNEADLIAAYTLHETGHVMFTNNDRWAIGTALDPFRMGRSFVHPFANGLEDGRMEQAVRVAGVARNAHVQFQRLLNMLVADMDKSWNPCDIVHAPFTLAVLSREAFGNGNAFSSTLLQRIPEPKRSIYAAAVDACKTAPMGYDEDCWAFKTAAQFLKSWKALTGEAPVRPPEAAANEPEGHDAGYPSLDDDEGPEGDEWADGSEAFDFPGAVDDEADDEAPTIIRPPVEQDDPDADGFGDLDTDAADNEGRDDGDDFAPTKDRPLDTGYVEPDAAVPDVGVADDADADVGADADADADEPAMPSHGGGGGDEPGGDDPTAGTEEFPDVPDSTGPARSAEPSVDSMFKRISKRTEGADQSELDGFSPATSTDLKETLEQWRRYADEPRIDLDGNTVGALKTQLSKMLLSVDRIGWEDGSTSGRFDVRRTSRMLSGSERVFRLRTESEAVKTAVTIVIDLSSSMDGDRLTCATQAAWSIATAIERVGCDVQVVGYGSERGNTLDQKELTDMEGTRAPVAKQAKYRHGGLAVIKDFRQKCGARREVFEQLGKTTIGNTPDYHCVRTAAEQLLLHDAQRKVVISITDGCGDYEPMKRFAVAFEKLHRIPILGLGIQTAEHHMRKAYTRFACIREVKELAQTAIRSLMEQLDGLGDQTMFEEHEREAA